VSKLTSYDGSESISGTFAIVEDAATAFKYTITYSLAGLPPSTTSGWHVHSGRQTGFRWILVRVHSSLTDHYIYVTGKTCESTTSPYAETTAGHYLLDALDPWTDSYTADANGEVSAQKTDSGTWRAWGIL
jgi:hypothetical protein